MGKQWPRAAAVRRGVTPPLSAAVAAATLLSGGITTRVRELSDGRPMRQRHRIGNAEAYRDAKVAAEEDDLPFRTLRWIEASSDRLTAIALWVGRCTELANRFPAPPLQPGGNQLVLRDSEGLAATRLQKYREVCGCGAEAEAKAQAGQA